MCRMLYVLGFTFINRLNNYTYNVARLTYNLSGKNNFKNTSRRVVIFYVDTGLMLI